MKTVMLGSFRFRAFKLRIGKEEAVKTLSDRRNKGMKRDFPVQACHQSSRAFRGLLRIGPSTTAEGEKAYRVPIYHVDLAE